MQAELITGWESFPCSADSAKHFTFTVLFPLQQTLLFSLLQRGKLRFREKRAQGHLATKSKEPISANLSDSTLLLGRSRENADHQAPQNTGIKKLFLKVAT